MPRPGWFTRWWMRLSPPTIYDETEEEEHRRRQAATVAKIERLAVSYRQEDAIFKRRGRREGPPW